MHSEATPRTIAIKKHAFTFDSSCGASLITSLLLAVAMTKTNKLQKKMRIFAIFEKLTANNYVTTLEHSDRDW